MWLAMFFGEPHGFLFEVSNRIAHIGASMKRVLIAAFILVLGALPASANEKVCDLKTNLRKLWSEHVIWTRAYIMDAVSDHPGAKPASERLLKNQDDIGAAIAGYYGKDAGNKLAQLLRTHILLAAKLIDALKAADKEEQDRLDDEWHDNAIEIATFLTDANPNWSAPMLTEMLNKHLSLTNHEVTARLKKDWAADIKAFNAVYDQALDMADDLTRGIVKQFPAKFGLLQPQNKANMKAKAPSKAKSQPESKSEKAAKD
jgi:hypothetical protein